MLTEKKNYRMINFHYLHHLPPSSYLVTLPKTSPHGQYYKDNGNPLGPKL